MSDSSLLKNDSVVSKHQDTKSSSRIIGLTPDDRRRMAELYAGGLTCQKIADIFGCSNGNVLYTLKKLGVQRRPCAFKVKVPIEKHPLIIQMYEAGQSCYKIAKEFECTNVCIRNILQKHGIKLRPTSTPGEYSEEICQRMVDLYKQGNTQESIATQFGCSVRILKRIFDEYEVEIRHESSTQFQSRFTEQDHQRMVMMYENEKSQSEIAREFGCRPFAVARILKKLGVKKRPLPSYHQITPKDREVIMELHGRRKSHQEIAAQIGCCKETVMAIIRQHNVPVRVQGPDAFSVEEQQRMVDLYEGGLSLDKIAVEFKCGRQTVTLVLRKRRVTIRPSGYAGQLSPTKRGKMLALYEAGFSGAEIAEKFGCDLAMVASVIGITTEKTQNTHSTSSTPISDEDQQRIVKLYEGDTTLEPNTTSKPIKDTITTTLETPLQISFETLVRDFWSDESRAVDVLMLPPDFRSVITENVEQALAYAWQTLKSI
jgi:transposase-like protein/uncharacterized protein (DUF433 family)